MIGGRRLGVAERCHAADHAADPRCLGHHGRIADEARGDATCVVARIAAAASAPRIRFSLILPHPTIADMNRTHTTVRPMSTDDTIAACSAATATQPHRARRCRTAHYTPFSTTRP